MKNKNKYFFIFFYFSLFFSSKTLQAQVTGKVFRDFNANGVQTSTVPDPIELGLKDVTVNAYDNSNTLFTATTDANGNYTIAGGSGSYRVEFVLPPFYYASKGSVSNSTVQFVAAGATANLGVNAPEDYCQNNPPMAVNRYINGNNSSGTSGAATTLLKFNYNESGNSVSPSALATASIAGTTWGLAYQRESKKLFSAAYLKRHAGYGPLGTGGIYITDMATSTTTNFINLNGLAGINTGTDTHTGLVGDYTQPSTDAASFTEIGKRSFGDMDISDDGKHLFVVNLFDRKLYKIFIGNPAVVPTSSEIIGYTIPNPCGNSDNRPFALKYWKGKVYVGLVCSAETSQLATDMSASVYEFDPATGTFSASPILSFPLNYTKGRAWKPLAVSNKWYPWSNTWVGIPIDGGNGVASQPQPMFSDIEFDVDNSMILGFRDRGGDQYGVYNNFPDGSVMNSEYVNGGDILRASTSNSLTWAIESNGVAGSLNSGVPNGQGIGGSEFYKGDTYTGGETVYGHEEISNGGLALLKGSNEIAMTATDALAESFGFGGYNSGGIRYINNTNGTYSDGYMIYDTDTHTGTFQKAGGLGDIELLCNVAPIEIGNRVFIDTDRDGEQDPSEAGINTVIVKLFKAGVEVASTTTNASGEWYFTNLDANTDYEVKVLAANFPLGKELTTSNTTANGKDMIDSDALLVGTDAVIAYRTGSAGQNNHTLDFGFRVACNIAFTLINTNVTCNGANDGTITLNVTSGTAPYEYSIDDGVTFGSSSPSTTKIYNGLAPNPYKPAVRDANGCVKKCN